MTNDLIITECPAAFAEFARKHNGLVYLLQSMRGENGVTVAVADANIIISATGGGTNSGEGDPWHSIGSDGKLGIVQKHSSWTAPTTYPTSLYVVTASTTVSIAGGYIAATSGTTAITIGNGSVSAVGGYLASTSGTTAITIGNGRVSVSGGQFYLQNGAATVTFDSSAFVMKNTSGNTCVISFASITAGMSIVEIDVCVTGVAKKMLILGSAPY
jgi:hypothetical protein